ncbi:P1 family peptidase [Microlunatus spumicola]|uniref:P1 family peptidase n=1 Tax=Microlunatus spumicola TaxID=81499 RepID=A0ABP6WR56_9ACTN
MIDGFEVGHATADGDGWLTGTTVVLARDGAVGGVDVRGGGPGTRETELLDPSTLVERVHAVVLTGGSAYGLAAADGVMAGLEDLGVGLPVGPHPGEVVPIVPAAVIFDLGRGGPFRNRPDAAFGRRALAAAGADDPARGCVGAGTGARCGGLRGGVGWAELALPTGVRVAVLVVVNAAGSVVDPATGRLWADRRGWLATPTADERDALERGQRDAPLSLNTTIGVVLTDATLTKAQARKVAAVAHDGLARAVTPVHSMSDGDTVFCLASGRRPLSVEPTVGWAGTVPAFNALLESAADAFTAACLDAVLQAEGRGPWRSYAELAPSAVGREIPAGG